MAGLVTGFACQRKGNAVAGRESSGYEVAEPHGAHMALHARVAKVPGLFMYALGPLLYGST